MRSTQFAKNGWLQLLHSPAHDGVDGVELLQVHLHQLHHVVPQARLH
jgi:hypothetical protein